MRIVIVADFAESNGGAPAVAIASAVSLAACGAAVSYLHGVRGSPDSRLAAAGIDVVSLDLADVWDLPPVQGAAAGVWNRRAAVRLSDALAALPPGPRVLHLHQWTRSLSPAVFPVLLGSGHPLVVTLHDYFLACPNGVYYRFDREEPCRLVPLSAGCAVAPCDPRSGLHKSIRLLRAAATRATLRGAALAVVHVSDRGRDTIAPFLPPGIAQHRIDNPVEIARRRPATLAPSSRLAFVGRLTREKGADLVAAAAEAAGMPVIFVGEGPAEAEIRRLAPSAEITGWRSREDLDGLLRNGILAVAAPSRWYETGPLTVYEALAAGVPPVVSVRAGAAEKVAHGETGFVVQPGLDSLTSAFRRLATGDVARAMGRLAYERYWSAPLDAAAHAGALLRLYEELAGRRALAA